MPAAKKTAVPAKPTLGDLIDQLWGVKQERAALAKQDTVLSAQIADIETEIYTLADAQGTTAGRATKASISIGEQDVFNITDFDELAKFVKKTGYFHLFQRRITVDAARELFESKGNVPGLTPAKKRVIRVTTLK